MPDRNRFHEIKVNFADNETSGNDVGMTIGIIKDPTHDLSLKEAAELVLPNYMVGNKYEDKQVEGGVEYDKMTIQDMILVVSFTRNQNLTLTLIRELFYDDQC